MAIVNITVDEFLQFVCWTATDDAQCEGLNGYFSALRITDVELLTGSSFVFDPQLIFALSAGSSGTADPNLFPNPEINIATILLDPSKGLTFTGSGFAPMTLVRDVFVLGHEVPEPGVPPGPSPGAPTAWGYDSTVDTVFFSSVGPVPVPTQNEAANL